MNDLFYGFYPTQEPNPGLSGVIQTDPGSLYYGLAQSPTIAATVNERLAALDNSAVALGDRIQRVTDQTLREQLNTELAALVGAIRETLREVATTATAERALEIQEGIVPQIQAHLTSLTSAVRRATSGKQIQALVGIGLIGAGGLLALDELPRPNERLVCNVLAGHRSTCGSSCAGRSFWSD